jgi:sortase system peptidoglycan-associated protein
LALGGATGGPPGAALGAVIGIVVGNGYFARRQVGNLQASLSQNQIELAMIKEEAQELQRAHQIALQQLDRAIQRSTLVVPARLEVRSVDACCDNTALSLHFRTGSSDIESQYENQLTNLVNLFRQMPSSSVEITGYADRNGDASFNLALSQQRTEAVRDFFNRMGIQSSSMKTVAYGETQPLQPNQTLENDFFDRRVIVRLRDTSQQMLSRSTDSQ